MADSILHLNDTFSSYEELRKTVERYEKANRVQFWTRDAKKLHRASPSVYEIVKDYPQLEYCSLRLACIHGGKPFLPKDGSKKRKNRGTWKQDCKAEIFVKLSDDKNKLIIQRLNEEHNHTIPSAEVFKQFPKPRRLAGKRRMIQKGQVETKLKERSNSESGIRLENIVKTNSLSRSNNFRKVAKILEENYCSTVDLQIDEDDRVYGFFFQDSQMIENYSLFPEFLSVDGSYALTNINCRIYIFMIENSLGSSNIIGAGVMTDTSINSLDWLFQRFKDRNPKWEDTVIVMTDPQTNEEDLVTKYFPNAQKLICQSYASYVFKKDLTQKKMDLIDMDQEEYINYFKKLMNAESENEYNNILEDMEDNVSCTVMNYYHQKWDSSKNYWVKCFSGNISSYINLNLEDPNSKLRSAICSSKTFSTFIEKFFFFLYLRRSECQNELTKILKIFHKNPTEVELKYQKILTPYAFDKIKSKINLAESDISETKLQYKTENCDVICETEQNTYVVSEYSCVCNFFTLIKLPCEHVLIYRKIENMDLFDECLYSQRWTREYAQNLFILNENKLKNEQKEKNADDKFAEAESVCSALATLCSDAGMDEFEEKNQTNFKKLWSQKFR